MSNVGPRKAALGATARLRDRSSDGRAFNADYPGLSARRDRGLDLRLRRRGQHRRRPGEDARRHRRQEPTRRSWSSMAATTAPPRSLAPFPASRSSSFPSTSATASPCRSPIATASTTASSTSSPSTPTARTTPRRFRRSSQPLLDRPGRTSWWPVACWVKTRPPTSCARAACVSSPSS